jgi:hypothetical protein
MLTRCNLVVKHFGVHSYSSDKCLYFGERFVPIGVICREIFVSTEASIDRVLLVEAT